MPAAIALAPSSAQAQEVYARGGVPGVALGLGHRLGERFGVRAEVSTIGTLNRDYRRDHIDFDGRLKSDMAGLYLDAMLVGAFRLTGGVSFNDSRWYGTARPDGTGTIRINNYTVPYGSGDSVDFRAKFSRVAPYIGIGWGHHAPQRGWSFLADLGVMIGRFSTSVEANPALQARINALGGNGQAEVDAERQKVQRDLDKYRVLPVLMIGAAYRW